MDNNEMFDTYAIDIDSDIVDQDIDNIDLYGEIMEDNNTDFGNNIAFE